MNDLKTVSYLLWFVEVKCASEAQECTKIDVFVHFPGWKPQKLCVLAWIKDRVGFPAGEVGTVAKTAAQTSFLFWNG